jgi:hypothetical protein
VSNNFDPHQGLIVVIVRLWGPNGERGLELALDTGATITTIRTSALVRIGYDPALSPERIRMTTGSGVEYVPRLPINRIRALGQERVHFPVVAHTLPPSASVDGLLGLDFFRNRRLNLDFRAGRITLR